MSMSTTWGAWVLIASRALAAVDRFGDDFDARQILDQGAQIPAPHQRVIVDKEHANPVHRDLLRWLRRSTTG